MIAINVKPSRFQNTLAFSNTGAVESYRDVAVEAS
jgi:hypothetical protein